MSILGRQKWLHGAVWIAIGLSAAALRGDDGDIVGRTHVFVAKAQHDDPFGYRGGALDKELVALLDAFVQTAGTRGRNALTEASSKKAVERLQSSANSGDVQVIAWATIVNAASRPAHGVSSQCLILARYRGIHDADEDVGVLCHISGPTGNLHSKWKLGYEDTPFLKPVFVGTWPIDEEQMIEFLKGTNFGLRNFLLDAEDVVVVTSYLPEAKRLNGEFDKGLGPDEKAKLRRMYIETIGKSNGRR